MAASFALVALAPPRLFARLEAFSARWSAPAVPWGEAVSTAASLLSLAAIVLLATAGLLGSRDPLANPLPLFVWAVWWIGFTYLHAAFGNLWAHVNPWIGLYRLLTAAGRLRRRREHPPLQYPTWAGHWPAVAGFAAFAWFELIHPAPSDPAVLASLVASYLLFHLGGVLAFGEGWLRRAEPFTVFFGMVSSLAPLGARVPGRSTPGPAAAREVELTLPSLRLLRGRCRPRASPSSSSSCSRPCRSTGCPARSPGSGCSARTRSPTRAAPRSWFPTRLDFSLCSAGWRWPTWRPCGSWRLWPASAPRRPGSSRSSRSRSFPSPAAFTSRTTCRSSW